jgi:hypothetical protein
LHDLQDSQQAEPSPVTEKAIESAIAEMIEISGIYKESLSLRREYMKLLLPNTPKRFWCMVKHAIASRGFASEVWQATSSDSDGV